jgi:hypothetical protein
MIMATMKAVGDGDGGDDGDDDDGQAVMLKTTKLESEERERVQTVAVVPRSVVVRGGVTSSPSSPHRSVVAGEDEEKGPTTGWS